MPIYEYACDQCNSRFEKLVPKMDAVVSCPSCQSAQLRRLPSVFAPRTGRARAPGPGYPPGASTGADAFPPGCGRCGSSTPGQCNLN